eukprot:TRINITY_DN669_c1_g1_i1.p1 TRINITY_DN669_c1_g1~~TRINITY_DN669_c1_g1_i1.p1  ORF type:complete len:544 (+),score=173.65 TRINITY_DN669_c1_g1_i1:131-1762(+)
MDPIVLYENEFAWVLHNETGAVVVVEGPARVVLRPDETMIQKSNKIVLKENYYCIVINPYDEKSGEYAMGTREVREGPREFSLYPRERMDGGVRQAHVIRAEQSIVLLAKRHDKVLGHKAGEMYKYMGPLKYIPKKHEEVVEIRDSIVVPQNEGIYVVDKNTGKARLVEGPVCYNLGVDEELYEKKLTKEQYDSLGISSGCRWKAVSLGCADGEIACIIDRLSGLETYLSGPCIHLLGPEEEVKITVLSAGVPKEEARVKAWKIRTREDFMNDRFEVRTKDNAVLELDVFYKWRLLINDDTIVRIFQSHDFIGYACQSMQSRIREVIARLDFEVFHSSSVKLLREELFRTKDIPGFGSLYGRYYPETAMLVSDVDVKSMRPTDPEIASLLNESIRANMKIVCQKLEDAAQIQAEKERIENECEIEALRSDVITGANVNLRKEKLEKAKIDGEALLERARGARAAEEKLQRAQLELEVRKMKQMKELLQTKEGRKYLELIRVQNLGKKVSQTTVVPSTVRTMILPSSCVSGSLAHDEELQEDFE